MGLGSRVDGAFPALGFENDVIPAVNSYEWEFVFQSEPLMKVKSFFWGVEIVCWRSLVFWKTHLPMAGNAVHACCSFCWSEESSVATSERKHVKKHLFVCVGRIISSRSNAVLMGIAGKSNEMWQEGVSLCDKHACCRFLLEWRKFSSYLPQNVSM